MIFFFFTVYYDTVCGEFLKNGIPKRKDVLLHSQTGESNKVLTESAVVVYFSLKLSKELDLIFSLFVLLFFLYIYILNLVLRARPC